VELYNNVNMGRYANFLSAHVKVVADLEVKTKMAFVRLLRCDNWARK